MVDFKYAQCIRCYKEHTNFIKGKFYEINQIMSNGEYLVLTDDNGRQNTYTKSGKTLSFELYNTKSSPNLIDSFNIF